MSTRRCYLCERKANATENISLHRFPREQQLRSKWLNACNLSETDDVSKVYICSCHFKDENYRQKIALGKYVGNWLLPGAVPSVINARKMVHINDKVVQCLDIFIEDSEDISPERETISDDMNNEPATIVNVKTKCHQPSTLLKETTEPKNNENKLYVSPGENKNDDEIPDDDAGGLEEECVCTPKKRRVAEPRFVSEICVSDVATPKKAKRVIALVKQNDAKQRKKINALHRQKRDLLKRITYLRSMVKHLQQRGLMSESAGECVKIMARQKRRRRTVRDNEFESSDSDCHKVNKKKISHKQFKEELLLGLVGDLRVTTKTGRPSSNDKEQRLDGTLHIITLHPQRKHKDCTVCSNRNIPGGRKETTYICETCDRKPGLHVGECFKRYHTM